MRGIVKVYGDSITKTYRLTPLHTTEIKFFPTVKVLSSVYHLTYSLKSIRDSNMKRINAGGKIAITLQHSYPVWLSKGL